MTMRGERAAGRQSVMNKIICIAAAAVSVLSAFAVEAPRAAPVGWTQDFEAAKKVSAEKNIPMLLDFTGSDWCYWCKLMDSAVFARSEWSDWAEGRLVCVTIDFPQDASKVPEKWRSRNEALARKFGIQGFPTFVILAPGGEKELGRANCPGRSVTPSMFIKGVSKIMGDAFVAATDPLDEFWRNNDGKTVRRLPVDIVPENVFWSFGTRDFSDEMKTYNKLVDEGLAKSTYNCITHTLRCNPELGDPETLEAARAAFARAHQEGVKVYMDTDPRIARAEFFKKWPDEKQSIVRVVIAPATNGTARFSHAFQSVQDHMSWGSRSAYRPLNARVAAAVAAKCGADGALDIAHARPVEVKAESSLREWTDSRSRGKSNDANSWNMEDITKFSEVTLSGSAEGLAADETLVVTAVAEVYSIDVFSPNLIPFIRGLMARYKALGADGGMRDEWGFVPNYAPDCRSFFWSPNFDAAYAKETGRPLLGDFALLGAGPKGDAARSAAIGAYMKLTLARNVEIERDFYEYDKQLFGKDVYVCKHPTWYASICPQEFFHNGLDWWQAPRDWAQSDECVPLYAILGMCKKFGGPVWLNEGYTATPEHNVFRVWTYAMSGGRQVYHGLYSGSAKAMAKYAAMSWEERRIRTSLDLLAEGNVTAQSRVRLPNLITRAQVDSPVAFVFGHEDLVDWSGKGWNDHGRASILALMSKGWWGDAYPASEFALGTFTVDPAGWIKVGRQRYTVLATRHLRPAEKAALDKLVDGRTLKTKIFDADDTAAICAYLERCGATRQPLVKEDTKAGPICPEPDGTLRLTDGTAIRIRADWDHPCGLPIDETIESNGAKIAFAAEGLFAARAENGEAVAIAAGGLTRVEGAGISLKLDAQADVVLRKIGGEWHGIWQTSKKDAPVPAPLAALTKHWIRLLLPPHLNH